MVEAINYQRGVEDAWSRVTTFVPKLVAFLLILVIGYFIAKAIQKILAKLLEKVGFDRMVERGGVRQLLAHSDYDASGILAKLVYYALMLIVLSTAFGVFGANPISAYLHAVVAYLPLVFVAILIVIITAAIAAAVKTVIQNSLGGLSYGRLLANVAAGFIIALGVIAALDQLHIATRIVDAVLYAALAALVGVTVVAVGGGGIGPMSQRWQDVLRRYDEEKPRVQQAMRKPSPDGSAATTEPATERMPQAETDWRAGNRPAGGGFYAPPGR